MKMSTASGAPVLGVLGGMGPGATIDFMQRLTRLTPASKDQDHFPALVYSDPTTPDRSDAILGTGPSPLPAMIRGVKFLNGAGCDLIAIPCNSAHYWYDDLVGASRIPLLHIVDAATGHLRQARSDLSVIGVLATDGTNRAKIYESRLRGNGIRALHLADDHGTNPIMRGIRAYKSGYAEEARKLLIEGGRRLIERGAEALVFGCTDISAALPAVSDIDRVPVVDAAECLAAETLSWLSHSRSTSSTL